MRRLVFNLWYWLPGRPPWDTGISPPELKEIVEGAVPSSIPAPGRAIDLGCGTGTNAIYLARHGWQVVGVDFARRAIQKARRVAAAAGVADHCAFHAADVTDLSFLNPPFDLAFDLGCFHSLPPEDRPRYAASLARLMPGGALYLLYAFFPGAGPPPGVAEADVLATFQPAFRAIRIVQGEGRPSAWYTLQRA